MNNYTILYAEDEEQTRLNYTKILQRDFKKVYSCKDGQDAYDNYLKYKPNILLLDINMPKINGLELAKKIRQKDNTTRIIILTAYLEQDKLLLAAELNLTKYLPKPISRKDFRNALLLAVQQYKDIKHLNNSIYLKEKFIFYKSEKKLYKNNEEIKLTKNEILLLDILSSQSNRVFSIEDISYNLWFDIYEIETNRKKIKDIIKRLRKKLPVNTIENIYGIGYKLVQ